MLIKMYQDQLIGHGHASCYPSVAERDRHEAAKMAHIATMQYLLILLEDDRQFASRSGAILPLWVIGYAHYTKKRGMPEILLSRHYKE